MKEFSQKGYRNASTDAIVKEADISKGALFYYFNNKKGLFLYLYNYAIDVVKNEILMKFDDEDKDVFNRIRQTLMLKLEVLKRHPEIYNFLVAAYMENSQEVKNDLESTNKEILARNQRKIFEGIDISKFKEGVDIERAIHIILWTIEGYSNREMAKIKVLSINDINYYEMLKEIDRYLEMLKISFYK